MGGIATADDVLEFMIAGATAVQVGHRQLRRSVPLDEAARRPARLHDAPRTHAAGRPHRHARHDQAGDGVDQLLIALDVESAAEALALADTLRGVAGGFKIGSRLFTAEGPVIVRALVEHGDRVFLDLKFHDIPNTVAQRRRGRHVARRVDGERARVRAARAMMQAARDAARETAARTGATPPLVIAVTVLTSMNAGDAGRDRRAAAPVARSGAAARGAGAAAGLDGVVASPQETASIRQRCGPDFAIVTPGIRGGGAATTGQGRSGADDERRPKRSPPARATSSSGGRSSRPRTRGRPRKRSSKNAGRRKELADCRLLIDD